MKSIHVYRFAVAALVMAAVGCTDATRAPRADEVVADGRAYANLLQRQGRAHVDAGARADLERLYLERLRLGLGSPFRLMEQAMLDVRLAPERRRLIAAALLARTLDGDMYRIDPSALDVIGPANAAGEPAGAAHLHLMTEAVREATDPRAGELAVRLAYLLVDAEGTISSRASGLSVRVAGQVLDRELARRDAVRLVTASRRERVDPLDLVRRWRAERRLEVEQPRIAALDRAAEKYAMRLAPRLADAIGDLVTGRGPTLAGGSHGYAAPILDPAAARRLLITLDSAAPPPQAPVAVTVNAIVKGMPDAPAQDDPATAVLTSLTDEERYALGAALISGDRPDLRSFLGRTTVWVGTALRPYAQERVWAATEKPPAARELAREFGLAAVEFDAAVPAEWRPHYRRVLHESLLDMQRVLPALDLHRLTVRFGPMPERAALALHDPSTRTIHLPPRTGAGTLAHEIAHDLDWQVALKRYDVRGDYGSDQSARRPSDRLAATFEGLTGAVLLSSSPVPIDQAQHQTRPAEVFARSIDWLVAASLAREGRSNGYLSSVQDDLLTGYGTVTAPDISGRAGAALVGILDEVAPLHAETRAWFLEEFGPGRSLTPTDLVRQVTQAAQHTAQAGTASAPSIAIALEQVRDAALQAIEMGVCTPAATLDPELADLRRGLVQAAAEARARGLAKQSATFAFGPEGAAWVSARLEPGPWTEPSDSIHVGVVRRLAQEARVFDPQQQSEERSRFLILKQDVRCGAESIFGDMSVAGI